MGAAPAVLDIPFATPQLTGPGVDLGSLMETLASFRVGLEGLMDLGGQGGLWE